MFNFQNNNPATDEIGKLHIWVGDLALLVRDRRNFFYPRIYLENLCWRRRFLRCDALSHLCKTYINKLT